MSEVAFSYIKINNDVFRFDSNYFQKTYLLQEKAIRKHNYKTLQQLKVELKSFGAYSLNNSVEYVEEGVPFIRGVNMKHGRIMFNDMIYITPEANKLLWKSEVRPEMVMLSMSGTIGDVAIASKQLNYPLNSNQDIAKIDTNGRINPYFLYSFLLSRFGQNYLKREARGSVQQHVFLSQMEQFEIPLFRDGLVDAIQKIALDSENRLFDSQQTYAKAEEILLSEINLKDFVPNNDPINVKNFTESFATTGRLDAEYYQKKYEEVVARIQQKSCDVLDNLVYISKSIEPGSAHYAEEGLPFLRVADYSKYGTTTPQKFLSGEFVKENEALIKRLKPKKGTILFSKDGSVGTAFHLREDINCITSGAVLHLKVKDEKRLIPEYLTLALNSKVVQMQAERDAGGSIILHWRVSEIEKVVVPIVSYEKQQEIAALIEQSFALKKESERLLEVAKRSVEMAIEQDEAAALSYIQANT